MPLVLAMFTPLWLGCGSRDVEKGGIEAPAESRQSDGYETRVFRVPADFPDRLMQAAIDKERKAHKDDPFWNPGGGSGTICTFYTTLPRMLEMLHEISFSEGAYLKFSPNRGELVVYNGEQQLGQLDLLLREIGPMPALTIDEELFQPHEPMMLDGGEFPVGLTKRQWRWSHQAMKVFEAGAAPDGNDGWVDPFADPSDPPPPPPRELTLREHFLCCGISFTEGASIHYDRDMEILTSVNDENGTFNIELMLLTVAVKIAKEEAAE